MESQRLKFRRFTLADVDNMIELEGDADVMKFTPRRVPLSRETIELRLKEDVEEEKINAPFGIWAVELKTNNDFAGWICLMKNDREFPELGFMIVQRHWGKGIATEAAIRLLEHGFLELNSEKIVAKTDQDNHASKNVLTKIGFRQVKSESVEDKVLQQTIQLDVFEISRESFT